ncbi:MAG: PepSY domain-containing protein [Oceanicaulis sp.]
MNAARWIVRAHKWLALVVGIQIFLWVLGGFAMSLMPIERVRAEHTIAPTPDYPLPLAQVLTAERAAAIAGLPEVETATLTRWHDGPVWRFEAGGQAVVVDALSGLRRTPIDAQTARDIATAGYAGEAAILNVEYFAEPHWEYRRDHPAWRVTFDDGEGTRLYVNAATGVIDARRNDMWRVFDFFWMLHIMDYKERENFNHPLLTAMAGLALFTVISGLTLLTVRMRRIVLLQLARRRRRERPLFRPRN